MMRSFGAAALFAGQFVVTRGFLIMVLPLDVPSHVVCFGRVQAYSLRVACPASVCGAHGAGLGAMEAAWRAKALRLPDTVAVLLSGYGVRFPAAVAGECYVLRESPGRDAVRHR